LKPIYNSICTVSFEVVAAKRANTNVTLLLNFLGNKKEPCFNSIYSVQQLQGFTISHNELFTLSFFLFFSSFQRLAVYKAHHNAR